MLTIETSHFPAADDITLDSLEYLFGPAANTNPRPIPWVQIETTAQRAEQLSGEQERRLQHLEQELARNSRQLQRICTFVGYMQGLLQEKEEQLKALPDLRYKAALAVARGLEVDRSKEKIRELEEQLQRLEHRPHQNWEEMLKTLVASLNTDEAAISILEWLGFISLSGILYTLIVGV